MLPTQSTPESVESLLLTYGYPVERDEDSLWVRGPGEPVRSYAVEYDRDREWWLLVQRVGGKEVQQLTRLDTAQQIVEAIFRLEAACGK
jgi:hypothetical protein